MKKILFTLTAILLMFSFIFAVSAFEDVTVKDNCFEAVNTLTSLNVIKGKSETEFAPDELVNREQMAALMTRLYTTTFSEGGTNYTPFTDIEDEYYNYVISWCYDAGVINGTTSTTFAPKDNIIFQDALTMACRLLGYTDLSYPMGYITKARMIGLMNNLDITYDKELTRGETAILLYNTLEADGKEIVNSSTVEWHDRTDSTGAITDSYPLVVSYERNFSIAYDIYNFKSITFQVVGTENFSFGNFAKGDEDAFNLIEVENKRYKGEAKLYNFEDLMIAEGTNGDDYILTYINVLFKGKDIDDENAIILSTSVITNTNVDDTIEVYYKNVNNKLVAQDDRLLINGKVYDANSLVYTIDNDGVITKLNDKLSAVAPVFFQTDYKNTGKYAQVVYDFENDGKLDAIIFIPAELYEITKITNKGVYTLKNVNDNTKANIVIDTKDEDEDEDKNLVILAKNVDEDDFVITYTFGNYIYIAEVLEPTITTVVKKSNKNYTLANGNTVSFAADNTPIVAGPKNTDIVLDGKEVALYIINDKIVYSNDATKLGYTPYNYAFVVNAADTETYIDTEDGTIETVYNLIAFVDGKAITIPTVEDYTKANDWNTMLHNITTITEIKNGKYTLETGLVVKDSKYEELVNGSITYNTISKLYKMNDGKIVFLDENSELYVRGNKINNGVETYDTVKRYTMNNTPTTAFQNGQVIDSAILRKNFDKNDKVESYTLVVGYVNVASGDVFGGDTDYSDYRILLSTGLALDKDKDASYATYEVINPVNGEITTIVDTTSETSVASTLAAGTVVKFRTDNKIVEVSAANEVFSGSSIAGTTAMIKVDRVINDNIVIFDGLASDNNGAELILDDINIVILDENDEGEIEVELSDDYTILEDKVVRIYTDANMNYKAYYVVIIPEEWATEAGFEIE